MRILFCAAGLAGLIFLGGGEETAKPQVEEIAFGTGPGTKSFGPASGHVAAIRVIEGQTRAIGVCVYGSGGATSFPPIAKGELIPMVGFVYRVVSANSGIHAKWVKAEDLPKGISPAPDSLAIPVRRFDRFGLCTIRNDHVFVVEIGQDADGKFADLRIDNAPNSTSLRVRINDTVRYSTYSRVVRNIVPIDEKQRVIGWIELGPEKTFGKK